MKSSGMNLSSGTRTRSVRFRGFTLALVLLSTCACTDCDVRTVTAQAGEAAVLPCTCPPDHQPPYLVWQREVGNQTLVVSAYRGENITDDMQAEEYRNRTKLNLKGNCSLTLLSVTPSDQGLYTCYYRTRPITHDNIYLEITEIQPSPEKLWSVQKTVVTSSVCGLLAFVIISVAAAVYVGIARKNRRGMNGFTPALTRSV